MQVVSLNNELFAARAEAMAAEEAVLWELSGRLMGCLDDVETVSVTFVSRNCYFVTQHESAAHEAALAAEEAVLWELSGRLMGCLDDVETVSVAFVTQSNTKTASL
jgi:hypothetical protein